MFHRETPMYFRRSMKQNRLLIIPVPPPPSADPVLAWSNSVLHCDFKDYAPFRSGAAFCQLLHMLYPQYIDLRLVHFQCKQLVECILNFEYLQLGLTRANIIFHVPVRRLILDNATAESRKLLKWFYEVYQQRPPRQRVYNACQARSQQAIKVASLIEETIIRQYFFEMDARRMCIEKLVPKLLGHLPAVVYATQMNPMAVFVCRDKFGLASTEVERELIMVNNCSEYMKPSKYFWAERDLVLDLERLHVQRSGSGLPNCIEVNRRERSTRWPWQQTYLFPDELQLLVNTLPTRRYTNMLNCMAQSCYPTCINTRLRQLFNVRLLIVSYTEWMASLVNKQHTAPQRNANKQTAKSQRLLLVLINLNATDINDLSHWSKPARVDRFKPRRIIRLPGYLGDQLHALRRLLERRELRLVPTTMAAMLPLTEPIEGAYETQLAEAMEDYIMCQTAPQANKPRDNIPVSCSSCVLA